MPTTAMAPKSATMVKFGCINIPDGKLAPMPENADLVFIYIDLHIGVMLKNRNAGIKEKWFSTQTKASPCEP